MTSDMQPVLNRIDDRVDDLVELTADLIRCRSVTPEEGGALEHLEKLLGAHGFRCTRIDRGGVANLYARWGDAAPVFGFNGHTDTSFTGTSADLRMVSNIEPEDELRGRIVGESTGRSSGCRDDRADPSTRPPPRRCRRARTSLDERRVLRRVRRPSPVHGPSGCRRSRW